MNDDVTKKAEALILGRTAPDAVRRLADAGLLVDELPAERVPVGTRKRDRRTGFEAIRTDDEDGFPWMCYRRGGNRWLIDDGVADWEVITDAPQDMRGESE